MTRATAQVHVKDSPMPVDMHSEDAGEFGEEQIIDMMFTGLSSPDRVRQMEVISGREFAYETITETAINPDGEAVRFENAGRSLAYEAFMEEAVVIQINETQDEKAAPVVFLGINGDGRWIPRGVPVRLPRKFVERLAQSAERSFKTPKINATEDSDNERPTRSKNVQAYPFNVLRDSNPNKKLVRSWLMRVTKQST